MRTVLVNPRRRTRRRSKSGGTIVRVRNADLAPNPRRKRRSHRRRYRRNASLSPVMLMNPRRRRRHNPLILPNRSRRRRRHRNPAFSIMEAAKASAYGFLGGGTAFAINRFIIGKIGYDQAGDVDTSPNAVWIRSAARVAVSMAASLFFPGQYGAAVTGGMAYSTLRDIDIWWALKQSAQSPAGLSGVEADLQDVLDDVYS